MLWDLLQQYQIANRQSEGEALAKRTHTLDGRVHQLELEINATRAQLKQLTEILENRFGEDLNGDGKVGR
ncbi:MAG: hypothetical protein ABMA26_20575 [Limisphaerales bacterium]